MVKTICSKSLHQCMLADGVYVVTLLLCKGTIKDFKAACLKIFSSFLLRGLSGPLLQTPKDLVATLTARQRNCMELTVTGDAGF